MKTIFNSKILSGILDSDFRDFTVTEIKGVTLNAVLEETDLYRFWDDVSDALQNNQSIMFMSTEVEQPFLFANEEVFWLYYELDEILSRLEIGSADTNKNRLN